MSSRRRARHGALRSPERPLSPAANWYSRPSRDLRCTDCTDPKPPVEAAHGPPFGASSPVSAASGYERTHCAGTAAVPLLQSQKLQRRGHPSRRGRHRNVALDGRLTAGDEEWEVGPRGRAAGRRNMRSSVVAAEIEVDPNRLATLVSARTLDKGATSLQATETLTPCRLRAGQTLIRERQHRSCPIMIRTDHACGAPATPWRAAVHLRRSCG